MTSLDNSIFSIGKYRVIGTLGRGAMGVVYKAQDPEIGRIVAVKVLRSIENSDQAQIEAALEQFKLEARSAGNLRHPKIITVFEVSSQGSSPYIVMDFIDGQGLDQILARNGALRVEYALQLLNQVAEGLDYAHERGVIHRDIKPSNILVDSSGGAFIVDFGVASIGRTTIDPGGPLVGSPGYMSPEQVLSKRIDRFSDLFSFAILAFELLSGYRPFEGETFNAVISQIINSQPRSMSSLRPEFPLEVEVIFEKALAKKSQDRYSSAREFVAALEEILGASRDMDSGKGRQRAPSHWKPLEVDGSLKASLERGLIPVGQVPERLDSGIEGIDYNGWERPAVSAKHGQSNSRGWETDSRPGGLFRARDMGSANESVVSGAFWNKIVLLLLAAIFIFSGILVIWFFVVKTNPVHSRSTDAEVIISNEPMQMPEALTADRYEVPVVGTPLNQLNDRQLLGVLVKGEYPIEELLKAITIASQKQISGRHEALVHLLNNDSYVVRIEALKELSLSHDKRFVPSVLIALEDHDPLVRIAGANTLRDLGDRKAVPYLQARLEREELAEVRGSIRRAVEQLNGYPMQ